MNKKLISYIPHGINEDFFYPITSEKPEFSIIDNFKKQLFNGKEYNYICLFNSRNIRRKQIPDLLRSWKVFIDNYLTEQQAKSSLLLLKTHKQDPNGTDLEAVKEMLFDYNQNGLYNIEFIEQPMSVQGMNMLYNICDVFINISSAEGWGLGVTEAMMVGKPVIVNVIGGLQDQIRFEDENGKWINFTEEFPTNSGAKYKKCGKWGFPVFSKVKNMLGSISTPYIYEVLIDPSEVAEQLWNVYELKQNDVSQYNNICKLAREWVLSDESKMSAKNMCKEMINTINKTLDIFKSRPQYHLEQINISTSSKHYNKYI